MAMNHRLLRPRASGGGFDPRSVPNLVAWWDAADASTVTLNSGNVSEWRDKSGLGHHVSQATAAYQPAYMTGRINGLNAIEFRGSNGVRLTRSSLSVAAPAVFTVLRRDAAFMTNNVENTAVAWDTLDGSRCAFGVIGSTNNNATGATFNRTSGTINYTASASFSEDTLYVSTCVSKPVGHSIYVNGSKGTDATQGTDGFDGIAIGNLRGIASVVANGYTFCGQICEMLVLSVAPNDSVRGTIERYLGSKWGASVA